MGGMPDWLYKSPGQQYENRSQTCHPKGKSYRDAQLGVLVYSVKVEHTTEHEVIYVRDPVGEKRGEGETVAKR
jgi:hypothetical protein